MSLADWAAKKGSAGRPARPELRDGGDARRSGDARAPAPSGGGEYGGKGKFHLPVDHVAAMRVPKGGSSCASCVALEMKAGEAHCKSSDFQRWNGGDSKLPAPPDSFCSDWYTPDS